MVDYEIYGSIREYGCEGGDITGFVIKGINKILDSLNIMNMIEHGDNFWSYVYRNGIRNNRTKIEVEIVKDWVKGRYLRTKTCPTEDNNLLEMPIFTYNTFTGKYEPCF